MGAVVAASAVLLAACSGGGGAPSGGAAPSGLVVGATSDPDTLYPWKATQFQAVHVLEQLYGTLTELDADLEVVPGLAESWQVSEDGRTITMTLRRGVTFADGSAFDSADVKASLDRIRDEATGAVAAASLASVSGVEAPDPTTVVLTLSGPDAGILAALASVNLAMLPSDATEQALQATPNGTGPFRLTQRTPNQSMALAPNPDFWGGAPEVPSLEFRVIPDETSIVSAMQSGNVDFAVFDDPLVAQSAEGSGLTVTETPQLSYHVLQLNARRAPLDNLDVRLAIQCAIDRQQVLDTAALGEGEVIGPITSPAYRSDPAARPCPQRDVDAARRHLAAAGHAGGLTLSAIVSQGEYATSVNEATNIQAQLGEAGITLNLDVLESGAYVDRWVAADFQAAVALNGGRPDPDGMYGRYFTSTGNLNKVAGYSSPALDALFAQGKATADPEARKAIYQQVSAELENNAAWVWLFTSFTYTATSADVSGFTPMANGSLKHLRETTVGGS
ncbi:peptide/nickel transport system substrate-binding protein [Pseudonocardia hierapolitana]|uniref:Peptide/nickel transport system substrate-binding protein n=2 Tax=Pseudonocardia hierapolitana TaxID=1128676 RepID=A0A561T3W2_9PSEU|nr:peptide/nickel transport system substrate-binding protein [Pseudonocardia hierapolitana]